MFLANRTKAAQAHNARCYYFFLNSICERSVKCDVFTTNINYYITRECYAYSSLFIKTAAKTIELL